MNPQKLIDNFSTHLKNTIARAISFASYLKQPQVEPIHLLIALSEEQGSVAAEIIKKSGLKAELLRPQAPVYDGPAPEAPDAAARQMTMTLPDLSPASRQALEKSLLLAYDRGHNYIGTEHLLYGLITGTDRDIDAAIAVVGANKKQLEERTETAFEAVSRFANLDDVMETFNDLAAPEGTPAGQNSTLAGKAKPGREGEPSALEFFTVNLTDPRVEKRIDPVIGREREIERLVNILCRRTKNNPILIGEPGVGKTAIVEGLAKKIRGGRMPDVLKRKKILSLDLTLMIAGTIYRGEFESRLKQIIDEIADHPEYILFIDELHNIIGAGSNQGTLDAANILKPALARGQIRCIGATTLDEYKKYIASDPALERRFQPITVEEPSREDTLQILSGIKKYYEDFHRLTITPGALAAAVQLSGKYIHDQFQPDKSIDLIDEAAAAVRVRQKATPSEIKQTALEEKIESLEKRKEEAIANERLEEALAHKTAVAGLKRRLAQMKKRRGRAKRTAPAVMPGDISATLAARLGLDPSFLSLSEWDELERVERLLDERIIGQKPAAKEVIGLLRRSCLGLRRPRRPLASFLFAGPSGVGKTEFAKVLAEALYHDPKTLIKLDMSEFAEAHSVSKLLGSPAGYIGYKDRNRFIDEVKKRPYSIILFDEIDKAHADVRKLLLQILDEGELADAGGKKIHFHHAIIILTTNLGGSLFKSHGIGFGSASAGEARPGAQGELRSRVISLLKEELSPAVMSRLDSVCLFNPLAKEDLRRILDLQLKTMSDQLKNAQKLSIAPDESAIAALANEAYNPDLGARQVSQILERIVPELVIGLLENPGRRKQRYTLTKGQENYKLI